jgi:ceramide glucosyltransferase
MITAILLTIFYLLALLGCVYTAGAILCVWLYGRRSDPVPTRFPVVTILKPLFGEEPRLFENLCSFVEQDYQGPAEFIFGVADAKDPAIAAVQQLKQTFPGVAIRLVVDPQRHGTNGKVSNLINMSRTMAGEIVLVADSDIVVEPDYLSRVVGALEQPGMGGVTCLYRGISLPNLWSRLATGYVDNQFLPNVIVGVTLGLAKPCFGSTIATTKHNLGWLGGFSGLKNKLADDYELGDNLRAIGAQIAVPARPVVGHMSAADCLSALVRQEHRWQRTIRAVDPLGFAGSVVTHVLPFAVLSVLASGFSLFSLGLLVVAAGLRVGLHLQVKSFVRKDTADLSLLPVRDLLSFAVFFLSFLPLSIEWRGHRFGVHADGVMTGRI